MTNPLSQPLDLPCGVTLAGRLCKAATSEGLADADNHSTRQLETLYRRWARSGVGLMFSGNMQIDRDHLERPGNVVIDDTAVGAARLRALAEAGASGGAAFWAQLSHTGRQVQSTINPAPLAPSEVELEVFRGGDYAFARPRAMTEAEINHAVDQFAIAAARVKVAGFGGVTLHAAHGYLISQFLSPRTNRRSDGWGGDLAGRARFLIAVLDAVRDAVGPSFPIGIKLNSSDFQKGGFTAADCVDLVRMLDPARLDLLELSGGSLEQPKVMGISLQDEGEDGQPASTRRREAYFLDFAARVRAAARMPVMVVGGFRSRAVMAEALEGGELDLVGIARPMIAEPEAPRRLLAGEIDRLASHESRFDLLHFMPWLNVQLERLGDGLNPDLDLSGEAAVAIFIESERRRLTALLERRRTAA